MTTTIRITSIAAALALGLASTASAQSLATYGSAEVAGFGEGSALIGATVSPSHVGWGPIASIALQTYRYRSGLNSHTTAFAVSPSIGIQNSMSTGAVSASLGYSFVNKTFNSFVAGNQFGSSDGVFVSAMGNYWGNGENSAQVIGSYAFDSEYYWTRGRASHRLAPSAHPVYLGGELVLQGAPSQTIGVIKTPSQFVYEVGPTIEYRVSDSFRVGASGGLRGGNNNATSTGYVRIEFLSLTKLGGM